MLTFSTALLLILTAIAAVTDRAFRRVYNWTTYPGIVAALSINSFAYGWDGGSGLIESLKGLALCGGLMLLAFIFFPDLGGGDVKLVAMMGAFLGWQRGLEALLWTCVLGAAAGLAVLIWRVGLVRLIGAVFRQLLLSLRVASWLPLSEEERRHLGVPLYLAPAAVIAVVIVCFDLQRFL